MAILAGKRAVVLGCDGEGEFGQAAARRLAADGARVLVAASDVGMIQAFAQEIGGVAAECDISDRTSVFALAATAQDLWGGLDIAVQMTRAPYMKRFLDTDEALMERLARVQFLGPLFFFQAMIPIMSAGASIVTMSSVSARAVVNDIAAYQGTRAGIEQVVRCLAAEFGARGIRINAVAPGPTRTPATGALSEIFDRAAARSPMRRLGTVEEVAAAVAFLARDDCFLTGETLQANGGYGLVGAQIEAR